MAAGAMQFTMPIVEARAVQVADAGEVAADQGPRELSRPGQDQGVGGPLGGAPGLLAASRISPWSVIMRPFYSGSKGPGPSPTIGVTPTVSTAPRCRPRIAQTTPV